MQRGGMFRDTCGHRPSLEPPVKVSHAKRKFSNQSVAQGSVTRLKGLTRRHLARPRFHIEQFRERNAGGFSTWPVGCHVTRWLIESKASLRPQDQKGAFAFKQVRFAWYIHLVALISNMLSTDDIPVNFACRNGNLGEVRLFLTSLTSGCIEFTPLLAMDTCRLPSFRWTLRLT
ncbi:hypothetical protein AAMO2058_001374300 [Amorphochlora amoebiformis]